MKKKNYVEEKKITWCCFLNFFKPNSDFSCCGDQISSLYNIDDVLFTCPKRMYERKNFDRKKSEVIV